MFLLSETQNWIVSWNCEFRAFRGSKRNQQAFRIVSETSDFLTVLSFDMFKIWPTLVVGSLACHHWKDLWKRVGAYAAAFCNCNRMNWRASSRNVSLRHCNPSIDEVTLIVSMKVNFDMSELYFRQIEIQRILIKWFLKRSQCGKVL